MYRIIPDAEVIISNVLTGICLSVHRGRGYPSLWSQVPSQPLVPCPCRGWGVPSLWSQVHSTRPGGIPLSWSWQRGEGGYPSQDQYSLPRPGQHMGTPNPTPPHPPPPSLTLCVAESFMSQNVRSVY